MLDLTNSLKSKNQQKNQEQGVIANFANNSVSWKQFLTKQSASTPKPSTEKSWSWGNKPTSMAMQIAELECILSEMRDKKEKLKNTEKEIVSIEQTNSQDTVQPIESSASFNLPTITKTMQFNSKMKSLLAKCSINYNQFTKEQLLIMPSIILRLMTKSKNINASLKRFISLKMQGGTATSLLDQSLDHFITTGPNLSLDLMLEQLHCLELIAHNNDTETLSILANDSAKITKPLSINNLLLKDTLLLIEAAKKPTPRLAEEFCQAANGQREQAPASLYNQTKEDCLAPAA